jgi:hypothetical protein
LGEGTAGVDPLLGRGAGRVRGRKNRTLTQAELRAMGATPGLMAHRVGPDGRARLEQS